MTVDSVPRQRPWWGVLGVALLGLGGWLLATDVPRWNTTFYLFAWYGWLMVVDAVVFLRRRQSLLGSRRRELVAMMFWSVPFWLLFEAYNLRLENWYYVFAQRGAWQREVFGWAAFATVLPACFIHAELVWSWLRVRALRWRPRVLGSGAWWTLGTLAVASIVLPVLVPRYAFPLVWGATLFGPALLNRRLGGPSLLGDVEDGRPGRLMGLLLGGLVAGGVWEGFNSLARCKWIYTVPFFDQLKLFEMPLAGFLGFPILAVAAFEGYSLLCCLFRGGRHWEDGAPAAPEGRARSWLAVAAIAVAATGSHLYFAQLGWRSVASVRPLLEELTDLDTNARDALAAAGIDSPERFHRAIAESGAKAMARRLKVAPRSLVGAARQAALSLHKGMGPEAARMLLWAEVTTVGQLGEADAVTLWEQLGRIAAHQKMDRPSLSMVNVWVRAAQGADGPRR